MSKLVACKSCGKEIAKGVKKCVNCGADQRNFAGRHKILTALVVIVVLVIAGIAIGGGDKTGTAKAVTPAAVVDAIKVTAKDLSAAYEANEVKADQTYKGKTAEITGKVDSIGVILNSTYVTLSAEKEYSIVSVQCFFDDKAEIDKVSNLTKGDAVTFQGVIEGKSLNVEVKKCVIK